MVVINLDGFLVSLVKTDDIKEPLFFSISTCNLFAEIKAISIPEKKADKVIDMPIIKNSI
jgi:hypothetical protein